VGLWRYLFERRFAARARSAGDAYGGGVAKALGIPPEELR
jgi:hypothetical protein